MKCWHILLKIARTYKLYKLKVQQRWKQTWMCVSLDPRRPRRFRMWRYLSSSPITLGSKPPLVIRIALTCLGTRLQFSLFSGTTYPRDHHSRTLIFSHFKPIVFFFGISAQRARSTEHLKLKWMDRPCNIKTASSSLTMLFGGNV